MVYCIPFHHDELGGPAMFDSGEIVINERKKVHNTNVETKIDKVCRMDISIATATWKLRVRGKAWNMVAGRPSYIRNCLLLGAQEIVLLCDRTVKSVSWLTNDNIRERGTLTSFDPSNAIPS